MPKLANGAGDIMNGQKQMKEKIGGFGDNLTKLTDGLNKSIKTWPAGLFQKTS
ncbi:hypothetical protein CGLO_14557 [Colletotrichum gloeosporioides Cg-14]|uniref:Uncharacterized protein n=1 Tax=Colletotrichum gloeosporioides (strain Cg-14) TaxID=1237896 RepID=T0L404_COLGC|nr:hypothetical protein CGLO_14557 [Colletotrichum gloeosporioides Cg-14]